MATAINDHAFPPVFRRFPGLLAIHRRVGRLLYPRLGYIGRVVAAELDRLEPGARVIDAGCGAGELLFPAARRRQDIRFLGLDLRESNVAMVRRYAETRGFAFVDACRADLEHLGANEAPGPFDLVVVASVLQYLHDDVGALNRLRDRTARDGRLILYSPVNGIRILPGYDRLRAAFHPVDYEIANDHRRDYSADGLRAIVRDAGFRVISECALVSTPGKIAYELVSLVLLIVQRLPIILAVPLAALFIVGLGPVILLLRALDPLMPVGTPNALLVVASRSGIEPPGR